MPGSLEPLDLGVQIPYHFRCPISLELMRDPVTVSTGQTYDRSSIESWEATGNTTCPVTRAPLTDFTLIPNHTLRRLIQDWCVSHRSFGVERIPTPKQPADPATVRSLLSQAAAASSPSSARLAALRRLRSLSRDSDKNRSLISSLNARAILLGVAFGVGHSECDSEAEVAVEALCVAVMFPAYTEPECASIAADADRVSRLVRLLSHSSTEVRLAAAAMIEIVVAGTHAAELRLNVTSTEDVFEGVVDILRSPSSGRAAKVAIKALFAMCLVKQTRHRAVEAGAAEVLVERLGELDRCEAERALATVELLCRVPAGIEALARGRTAAAALVKVMMRVSERATEYAAGALLALCTAEEECRREAAAAGVVTQLLLVVQSDCTDRAKRKAQMLLKLLRDSWPLDCFHRNSDDFACSEVVLIPFS